ncbi:MAG: hypothetical protein A2W10_08795 [Deltaproteobacteria bacterium RBG_16_55_12]|nr:MAG: hypothetical protein A2W10_08795 [Deltaproteobacteria bacterium RBG_16_55_12]
MMLKWLPCCKWPILQPIFYLNHKAKMIFKMPEINNLRYFVTKMDIPQLGAGLAMLLLPL